MCMVGRGVKGLREGCYVAVMQSLAQRIEPVIAQALELGDHKEHDGLWQADSPDDGDAGRSVWKGMRRVACAVTRQPEWVSQGVWEGQWHGGVVSSWLPLSGEGKATTYNKGEMVHVHVANFQQGQNLLAITVGVRLQFGVLLDDYGRLQATRIEIVNRRERDRLAASLSRPTTASLLGPNRHWSSSSWGSTEVQPRDGSSQSARVEVENKAGKMECLGTWMDQRRHPLPLVSQPFTRPSSRDSSGSDNRGRLGTPRQMGQPMFEPVKSMLGVSGNTALYATSKTQRVQSSA